MEDFSFGSLNPTDFEELICDILNKRHYIDYERNDAFTTFKEGKDKGVDILNSTKENIYSIVVQAKHYENSGFSKLFSSLREELVKVKNLVPEPSQYIIGTSVDLSLSQKIKIYDLFDGYIKNIADILARRDICRYLEVFPEFLDKYPKIKFSSADSLKRILNYPVLSRRGIFTQEEFLMKLKLYVETKEYKIAKRIIEEKDFLLVTGLPGCGKTTLAEMLVYEFIQQGYQLVYAGENIKDFENAYIDGEEVKQIFYFDDFLGHTNYEIVNSRLGDNVLIRHLRKTKGSKVKKTILTTRTFILNDAVISSEKLKTLNFNDGTCSVELTSYSESIRKKILENHISISAISSKKKIILEKQNVVEFITNHENFSPRSIEFITLRKSIDTINDEEFENYVIRNFNYPKEIWQHAFDNQIDQFDKKLLLTLMSFSNEIYSEYLKSAFEHRISNENVDFREKRPFALYENCLKKLDDSFISIKRYEIEIIIDLINHSLKDFLLSTLKENKDEIELIALKAKYLNQILNIYPLFDIPFQIQIPKKILERIKNEEEFKLIDEDDATYFIRALYILKYDELNSFNLDLLKGFLRSINDWSFIISSQYFSYQAHFIFKDNAEISSKIFNNDLRGFFSSLIATESTYLNLKELLRQSEQDYGINLKDILHLNPEYNWREHFLKLLNDYIFEKKAEINKINPFNNNEDENSETPYEEKLDVLVREISDFSRDILKQKLGLEDTIWDSDLNFYN